MPSNPTLHLDRDPIFRRFALRTLNDARKISRELVSNLGRIKAYSLEGAKTEKARRHIRIRAEGHGHHIKDINWAIRSASNLLASGKNLRSNEFDVMISLIFVHLDELGVDLKDYLSQAPKKSQNDVSFKTLIGSLVERMYLIYDDLVIVHDAVTKRGRKPLEKVYQREVGSRLDQEPAPYLFAVRDGVLDQQQAKSERSAVIANAESLSVLRGQALELFTVIKLSNADPRLLVKVTRYLDGTAPENFSSIRLELYANEIRALVSTASDELGGSAIISATTLLLTHEQVMSQFSNWRDFVKRPLLSLRVSEEARSTNQSIVQCLISPGAAFKLSVSSHALKVGLDLREALDGRRDEQGRVEDAVFRSLANLVKANVSYAIGLIRKGSASIHGLTSSIYFSFFLKLLPHFKLFCGYVKELAWLVPVLDYIQELGKQTSSNEVLSPAKKKRAPGTAGPKTSNK